ncbi:hypothetical protein ACLB2K_022577 [Fragaria x ananassa]
MNEGILPSPLSNRKAITGSLSELKERMEKVVAETAELPKTIVRRVVKDKLSQCSKADADLNVHKEALTAFSESARIFIHYLSATYASLSLSPFFDFNSLSRIISIRMLCRANDICRGSKRQTINADDVFKALEDIEFPEFVGPLSKVLVSDSEFWELREKNAGKKAGGTSKAKEAKTKEAKTKEVKKKKKKRKLEEPPPKQEEENQDEDGSDGTSESSSKE